MLAPKAGGQSRPAAVTIYVGWSLNDTRARSSAPGSELTQSQVAAADEAAAHLRAAQTNGQREQANGPTMTRDSRWMTYGDDVAPLPALLVPSLFVSSEMRARACIIARARPKRSPISRPKPHRYDEPTFARLKSVCGRIGLAERLAREYLCVCARLVRCNLRAMKFTRDATLIAAARLGRTRESAIWRRHAREAPR